jgi:hypothetical protein
MNNTSKTYPLGQSFEVLPGLPPYGPRAIQCPAGWGHDAKEGFVVAFHLTSSQRWVGNFGRGLSHVDTVLAMPAVGKLAVIAGGALYEVDPKIPGPVEQAACCVTDTLEAPDAEKLILVWNHIELGCWGARGEVWNTGRISWDGFRNLKIDAGRITGDAWSPMGDRWFPLSVDINTGVVEGGAEDLLDYGEGRKAPTS